MTENPVPIRLLAAVGRLGVLYRAYDHIIAARSGALLMVPVWNVAGSLRSVVDGCPVSWMEAIELIHSTAELASGNFDFANGRPRPSDATRLTQFALAWQPAGWLADALRHIDGHAYGIAWSHPAGVRMACTPDLLEE